MRDGFARGQEYSQAHPAYAAMQDVHIGDWDCDVCAETFTSVPFFACASFEDCVFKTCQGCLPVCARPDLAAAAPPTAVPVPAAVAAEPAPAPAPLDLSRVRECRVCRDPLKVYNAQHPMWTNLGDIPEWSCDVCDSEKVGTDALFACHKFDECDFCACADCVDQTETGSSAAAPLAVAPPPAAAPPPIAPKPSPAASAATLSRTCPKCPGEGHLKIFDSSHPQFGQLGGWVEPDWNCDVCGNEFKYGSNDGMSCYVCDDYATCDWGACTVCACPVKSGEVRKSSQGKKDADGNPIKSKKKVSWKNRWLVLFDKAPTAQAGPQEAMLRYPGLPSSSGPSAVDAVFSTRVLRAGTTRVGRTSLLASRPLASSL